VRVKEIALGANYSCALTDSGHIYTFGNGEWGQLGLGGGLAGGGRGAAAAAGGGGGAGSGNNNGNVGGLGQDGSGTDVPVELLIPRRIPLFERIPAVHVAAGYAFAMAIVENYHVYFWGNNNHGQSGRGRSFFDPHTKKVDTPVLVETLEGKRIVQLSCGSFFALALSEDGTLYSWGLVDCVGLGTPEEVERHYHAVLGESLSNERRSVVLTPQVVTVKGRRRTGAAAGATPSSLSERIVRIRAGQWHSGAINDRGELFTWGVGYQGRLGHGSKTPSYVPTLVQGALEGQHVVDVACGSFHTVALTSRGAVFCWGDNASGQCGTTANSPDAFTAPYRVVGLEYVAGGVARSIACGRQHTVVVMEGPQPWCGLPCCQVDAGGRAAHSHAQVYCFGEVTRAGGAAGATAAASAVGNSGQSRAAAYGTHGVSMNGLNASTLPGSPGHTPFVTAGMNMAFQPPLAGVAGIYGLRPTLAGTAGHHHPHYQLVTGLQHVDVRAVVSGLHHTFAYVEELMTEVATHASPCQRSATAIHGYVPIYGGAIGGSGGGGAAACYLRGTSAGPMPFYPSDWGFGVGARGGPALPPPPPPSAASPAGVSGAVTGTPTRRFFLPS
jgi:alpha-tubulin suppressor-like RCC1 family protein